MLIGAVHTWFGGRPILNGATRSRPPLFQGRWLAALRWMVGPSSWNKQNWKVRNGILAGQSEVVATRARRLGGSVFTGSTKTPHGCFGLRAPKSMDRRLVVFACNSWELTHGLIGGAGNSEENMRR